MFFKAATAAGFYPLLAMVLAVIPVMWVVLVALLFSLLTGLATELCKSTTKFLLMVYLSGDLEVSVGPPFPLV